MRDPAALARLGAQARQARNAGPCTGHGRLGRLPAAGAGPANGVGNPLRPHPGRRHRAATRRPARTGSNRQPPAQRTALRPRQSASGGRLRHPAAPPGHTPHTGRQEHALSSAVRGPGRPGPLQQCRLRRVPGLVRHCQFHRQGAAECHGLSRGTRWPATQRFDPEPRPAGREHRALRLRQRRDAGRGLPAAPGRGGVAVASVDPRRLAAAAGDAAGARVRNRRPGPVEDERQPAPLPGAAGLRGAARPVGVRRLARSGKRHRDGVRSAAGRSPARRAGWPGASAQAHRMAPFLPSRAAGAGPCHGGRDLAVQPAGCAVGTAARCGRAFALAHGCEPSQAARMDHGCAGRGISAQRPGFLPAPTLADVDAVRAAGAGVAARCPSGGWFFAVRPVGLLGADQLVVGTQRHAGAGGEPARQGPALPAGAGPRYLAFLRALRGRARQSLAARQPADGARSGDRAPHVSHQHRAVPACSLLRAPVRLDQHGGTERPSAGHPGHGGPAGQAPWSPAELV